jgi:hypothetical protein
MNYKIPCGRTLGHGESCVSGHLCDQCTYISMLKRRCEAAERVIHTMYGEEEDRAFKEWQSSVKEMEK